VVVRESPGLGSGEKRIEHRKKRHFTAPEKWMTDMVDGTLIFGDPRDFAVEAGLEPNITPPSSVWGHMRVWCRGATLGNVEERCCALYPSSLEFAWLSSHLDELWDEALTGLGDQAAWDYLDGLLYGCQGDVEIEDHRTLDEMQEDWARYGKFNFLTNWGEQFDGYKSFIMCPPSGQVRILSRRLPAPLGLSVQVTKGAILEASRGFVRWFEEQETRLRGPGPTL
jgi:hypothetical protein